MSHGSPWWIFVLFAAMLFGMPPVICYYAYASAPSIPNFNVEFVVWVGTVGWLLVGVYATVMMNKRDARHKKKPELRVLNFQKKDVPPLYPREIPMEMLVELDLESIDHVLFRERAQEIVAKYMPGCVIKE